MIKKNGYGIAVFNLKFRYSIFINNKMFATPYETNTKHNETRNKSPKTQTFQSSLKAKEELSSLKHGNEQKNELKVREVINRPEYIKIMSQSPKNEDRSSHSYFKNKVHRGNQQDNIHPEWNRGNEKKNTIFHRTEPLCSQSLSRKQVLENIKPQVIIHNVNGNSQYQKLHDKLNYLQNKMTEMRSNLQRKRQEKKKYFEKEMKQRQKIKQKQYTSALSLKDTRTDPLKQVISQVSCKKNLKPVSFDPYSPRHNTYYVSEIVRAYKQQNSLAREHLISSIQLLRMISRTRIPTKQQISAKAVKYPRKPIHQDKKTVIFDLDQTLIHCNQNVNMPCDIKLPIKFITGQIIYAGINIRPHAVQLLRQLSKNFQIIIFTASHSCYANVVLNYLDPENKFISHRLFREHCYYTNQGIHVKDLRVINRDLSQTVLIDNAAYSYAFQIDNGIPIIPYYEGKVDFQLKALQTYLQSIIFCKDVREVNRNIFHLHRYTQFDNPQSLVKELYSNQLR